MPSDDSPVLKALSPKEFDQLLTLARLEVDDEQRAELAGDFQELLGFVEQLFSAPLAEPEDAGDAAEDAARGRADVVTASLPRDLALVNAPSAQGGYFKVPRTVEES